jgi:hypothetical protein
MKKIFPAVCFVLSFLFTSCGNNRVKIDVTDVKVPEVALNRLEQDIFNMDVNHIEAETEKLQKKYGAFYSIFIRSILNNGNVKDSSYAFRIKEFITDPDMKQAYADCQKQYASVDFLNAELTEMFKHYTYYFPNKSLPKTITMMSGFNYSSVLLDSTLAIGLEMYLGKNNIFYKMLALPNYKTLFMNKENIVPDATRALAFNQFPYNMNKNDFLSEITYMGKIMYLTDVLLPEIQDSLKIQYTSLQLDYCHQNEFNLWSYFATKKLLYTTDHAEIMKYTSEGPFTSAFSKEAPPRIAYWIGWQIVRQYMKNNPDSSVEMLMKETDAQKILSKSKYKPNK